MSATQPVTPRLRALTFALSMAASMPAFAQQMNHSTPADETAQPVEQPTMDHAYMDPGIQMPPPDHDTMNHGAMNHATMDHAPAEPDLPATALPRTPIPPITPADRAVAFPDVATVPVHDSRTHYLILLDQLEVWQTDAGNGLAWEATAWLGNDLDRLWVRSEGERIDSDIESADIEVFYGHAIAPWWDAVAGVRHDFGQGDGNRPAQTFAAIGVIGLAPYKLEIEATAYIGQSGQTGANVEAEYETLLTNRLILQWLVEAEAWARDDPGRAIGSGLNTLEAGLRLRYEFTRRFAPYIGVAWERAYGDTADFRRAHGDNTDHTRILAGLRFWF